jgi:hypothetical protein
MKIETKREINLGKINPMIKEVKIGILRVLNAKRSITEG